MDPLTQPMIDMFNKDRLNTRLHAHNNITQALPSHQEGHSKFHSETTYKKDYSVPNPELQYQKSEKMVSYFAKNKLHT